MAFTKRDIIEKLERAIASLEDDAADETLQKPFRAQARQTARAMRATLIYTERDMAGGAPPKPARRYPRRKTDVSR